MAKTKGKPRRKAGVPTKASGKKRVKNVAKAKKFKAAASKRRAKLAPKSNKLSKAKKAVKKVAPKSAAATTKQLKKQDDQNKRLEALMVRGRQRGFVTYDEILKSFPTIESDVMFLEEMYEKFSTAGIDVLEGGGMLEITEDATPEKGYARSDSQYDSIQMYLREIGKYPLLNAQEKHDLAKRIVEGDDEARNLLARANLRLVVSIAKKYVGR